jgi:hypothetical protein
MSDAVLSPLRDPASAFWHGSSGSVLESACPFSGDSHLRCLRSDGDADAQAGQWSRDTGHAGIWCVGRRSRRRRTRDRARAVQSVERGFDTCSGVAAAQPTERSAGTAQRRRQASDSGAGGSSSVEINPHVETAGRRRPARQRLMLTCCSQSRAGWRRRRRQSGSRATRHSRTACKRRADGVSSAAQAQQQQQTQRWARYGR